MKRIVWEKTKCTGCRVCEGVCSLHRENEFNPAKSRGFMLRTVKDSILYKLRVFCQQCEEANCMAVCPASAISDEDGVRLVDETKCLGCKMCEMACPVGAIAVSREKGVSVKCDQCAGLDEPQCVKYCWPKALEFVAAEEVASHAARAKSAELFDFPKKSKNDVYFKYYLKED